MTTPDILGAAALASLAALGAGAQPDDGLPEWDEDVVVVAERAPSPASEAPTVRVVEVAELRRSGALKLDDALRRVPGFALFRRSGSRTANPTTQGVSLRGVGASGASRALVLDDGVPLHDPFGAWVPWDRVPALALQRVELLRGGGADLHGSGALGGVVRLERRRPEHAIVDLLVGADDRDSALVAAFASAPAGRLHVDAAGDLWRTDGHVLVAPWQRGPVDVRASSRHELAEAGLRDDRGRLRWRARLHRFDEERGNGTPLQRNATDTWQLVTGGAWVSSERQAWTWSADALDQDYEQTFSAIAADRASEHLTREQHVPSRARGAEVQWMRALGPGMLAAGASLRASSGRSEESFTGAAGPERTSAGARQTSWGGWFEGIARWDDRAWLRGSLRAESWRQDDASRSSFAGRQQLPSREASALVPRVGAGRRVGARTWVSASAWKAFRAPTLNELHRDFRVGNVLTEANDALRPERLDGAEASVASRFPLRSGGRLDVIGTAFWSALDGAVGNVTVSSAPDLVVRRRENVGSLRARGIELDARARWGAWEAGLSHALTDSRVGRSAVGLEGKRAAQVPRHHLSLHLAHARERAWQSLDARWTSSMPEDDRNELTLASALVVDAAAGWSLRRGLAVELAAENLLDEDVEAGKTPALTLAAPRTLRAALRWAWPGSPAD